MNGPRRVLVSTLASNAGGVAAMTGFVVELLRQGGCTPVVAHYEPYSVTPGLSVPVHRLLQRRIGWLVRESFDGCETHAIGAWLPELEFTHYAASSPWRGLIDKADSYVCVSGNVLSATPFLQAGRPYLAWVATDWLGDRRERASQFPWPRRVLDRTIAAPVIRRLEQRALQQGVILALSEHTRQMLNRIAQPRQIDLVLPMPIDTDAFAPQRSAVSRGRIGFTGRINDPRKNIELLLLAMDRIAKEKADQTKLVLVGESPKDSLRLLIDKLDIGHKVELIPPVSKTRLIEILQTLDLFVVCSHQEGLCISALEAMACGCPVISTRCGGPEEFVRDDETGYLVEFEATEIADAITRVTSDRAKRDRLSANARALVERNYNTQRAREIFWSAFERSFQPKASVATAL